MKRVLGKKVVITLLIIMMLTALLQNFSFAKSENTQILKLKDKEYLIYLSDLADKEFKFAFSTKEKEKQLQFINSAKDKEEGNNVAYIDEKIYNTYFERGKAYLWVEQEENKIEAQLIDLSTALQEEKIQELNKVTKTIAVKVSEKELPVENKDGVKISHKIGTIQINDDENAKYFYQILAAVNNEDVQKLIELASKMNKVDNESSMYNKLETYSAFEKIYNKLAPVATDTNWVEVKNNEIPQPQEAKTGEQYVVFIKKEVEDKNVVDIQIMTCKDEYTQEYETKDVVVKETSKLPITYDNVILFVIAAVVLVLIVLVVVLKLRNKKEDK